MGDATDDAVWAKVQELMPNCSCGARMQPGGTEALGPMLVCTGCSSVSAVSFDWVDAKVAEARAVLRG